MKRMIAMLLILVLALSAGAVAEGGLAALVSAADKLAFGTENVTLKAEAKFSYDGQWFKTFRGEYRQDGYNSYMSVMLDTPHADGSVYTGGYTVIGNDGISYSNETYNGNYYLTLSCEPNNHILKKTPTLSALSGMAQSVAFLTGNLTAEAVALNGNTVTVKWNDVPEIVNSALTLMALNFMESQDLTWAVDDSPSFYYDDYTAYTAYTYEKLFGEKMPDDFYIAVERSAEAYDAMMAIYEAMYQETSVLSKEYDGGILYLRSDGSHEWYESEEAYLLAQGMIYVNYDSYVDTLSAYHAEKYGKPFDETLKNALIYSNNGELWDAYIALSNEMDEKYYAIVPEKEDTVLIVVHADGSYDEFNQLSRSPGYLTVARSIVSGFDSLKIANVDAVSTLDENGNVLTAKGVAAFTVIDRKGASHDLTVEFDCTADDYGTTHVAAFNPDDYGFVTFDEYLSQNGYDDGIDYSFDYETAVAELFGQTVEFAGNTYQAMVDEIPMD